MAVLSISTHIFLNIITIINILAIVFREPLLSNLYKFYKSGNTILYFVLFYIFLGIVNFITFFTNKHYEKIVQIYKNESEKKKKWGRIIALCYLIGSWAAWLISELFYTFKLHGRI